jgi:orotate phosphoribosyltransferase-like protein
MSEKEWRFSNINKSRSKEREGIPVVPLEKIDAINAEELDIANKQIEMIKGSLQDLAHRIEEDKPDIVVFLDLSARLFGSPFLKYLSETMKDNAPLVRFYNDQDLKGRYLHNEVNEDVIEGDFEQIRGKKVFFVDETFSMGKGAVALHEAAMKVGADAHYFALSKDPDVAQGLGEKGTHYNISETTHLAKVKALTDDGRIVVYENPIKNLFSRFASRLYVHDWQGETLPLDSKPKDTKGGGNIPNANSYYKPPDGMTMEEYVTTVSAKSDALVRAMKNKVYEALKEE